LRSLAMRAALAYTGRIMSPLRVRVDHVAIFELDVVVDGGCRGGVRGFAKRNFGIDRWGGTL
jgi:hypothetical protein